MAHTDTFDTSRQQRTAASDWRDWVRAPQARTAEERRKILRQRLLIGLGGIVAIAAIAWGVWWFFVASNYVSTDDAYVDASSAQITPQIDGTIASVPVNDTMHVKQGQVLIVIDPSDARIAKAQALANYNEAIRKRQQDFATTAAAASDIASKSADVQRAKIDNDRRTALSNSGAVSGDELTTARNALATAEAALSASQQEYEAQKAIVSGTDVIHNPQVLAAKAALDKADLDLSRTVIRAPVGGVVAQNGARVGQRVQIGAILMAVVPIAQAYVDANFKESQLQRVHNGEPVTLTSDLYGSGVVFHGHVVGLGGGTGSAFALIPAQNATGNWIKVVQRLPVRVALDPAELAKHPLRVGLSMDATVDLHD